MYSFKLFFPLHSSCTIDSCTIDTVNTMQIAEYIMSHKHYLIPYSFKKRQRKRTKINET